jgi:hypothetical protein
MVAPFQVFLGEELETFHPQKPAAGASESFFRDGEKLLAGRAKIFHTLDYRGLFQG